MFDYKAQKTKMEAREKLKARIILCQRFLKWLTAIVVILMFCFMFYDTRQRRVSKVSDQNGYDNPYTFCDKKGKNGKNCWIKINDNKTGKCAQTKSGPLTDNSLECVRNVFLPIYWTDLDMCFLSRSFRM